MKFLAVFVAVLAVAAGARHRWTLGELSEALQNPTTNPSLLPALTQGLNAYMEAIFSGLDYEYIYIGTAAIDLSSWSLQELSTAIENPETNPALVPYLKDALNALMEGLYSGSAQPTYAVVIPARDLSYWRLNELSNALLSPELSHDVAPYLIEGLNTLMAANFAGIDATSIVLAIPLDALPTEASASLPEAVVELTPVKALAAKLLNSKAETMKFLAVFVAVLAVAAGARHRWTLGELSEALQNPTTNPSLLPALTQGLNAYMEAIFSGLDYEYIYIGTAAIDLSSWSLQELSTAIENPETDPALVPYLKDALNALMEGLYTGSPQPAYSVVIPARDLSYWRLNELSNALSSPELSHDVAPYLIEGLNTLMAANFAGIDATSIVLAIPLDTLPTEASVSLPEAVVELAPVKAKLAASLKSLSTPSSTSKVLLNEINN
ncbi:uncharacterized protein LOC113521812 [Galleria mellonella]|uniref:Uncharacterized protein LOC113521812 n=1 Tax=Galleria mellonella TaxID=7137 RepID=A0ABM3MWU3_GALME|nr:uncharacterized protein LOC113521812 [Galleria mellonella]